MNLLQKASLVCISLSSVTALAADLPKAFVPANVIFCQPGSGCTNEVLLGHNYKVLSTPRFVVMVSVSKEGHYTRADVSIANNSPLPLKLFPEDFRVEVVSPKPKVLLYVPPAELKDVPVLAAATPVAAVELAPADAPEAEQPKITSATEDIDAVRGAGKEKAALQKTIDMEAFKKHLPVASIPPNEVLRGRVYFERDKKAQMVTVVLPVAGQVFEFPYELQR